MHFLPGSRKAGGYVMGGNLDGTTYEADTVQCHHCMRHIIVPPGPEDPGKLFGVCWSCDKFVCPECADKRTCTPWEREMERVEARDRMLRAILG